MVNKIFEQIKEFIEKNLMIVLSGATVLLLILLSITTYSLYKRSVNKKAYVGEYKALRLYRISDNKNWPIVENNFKGVLEKYPDTKGAEITKLYLGNLYFKTAQYEKAIKVYEELSQQIDKADVLYDLALLGIGYAYENLADFKKAIPYFEKVINNEKSAHKVEAFIEVGRCYEEMKDYKSAMEKYITVSKNYPENPWKSELIDKINQMKTTVQ